MGTEKKGNWWIWRVFWILLFITTFEVVLGILKVNEKLPEFIVYDKFLGLAWLTHIFIILTIIQFRNTGKSFNTIFLSIMAIIFFASYLILLT